MGYLSEKAAYLKGLSDGLELKADSKEGKIISAIIETIEEMAAEIDDVVLMQEEMQDQIDDLDEVLSEIDEEVNDIGDYLFDVDDMDDDFDEEDFDEDFDEDWDEEYSFECPKCGDMIYVDLGVLDNEEGRIVCPNCKEPIELEFDIDSEE
ncbi:MAG: CD1247 N-terminal domain-containing protein [Clostridia bacterium]